MQLKKNNIINSLSIFVPIRKNSKRIKNKNIKPLPGLKLGLTELKIKQLKKFKIQYLKKYNKNLEIVISTDCLKILKYTNKFSWIKVFERKKSLATDDSLEKLIRHVPQICKNEYILWTHVTSPMFNEIDYMKFIENFCFQKKKNNISKSAFSADIIQKFMLDEKRNWVSHNFRKKKWPKTQDVKRFFLVNSAAFIAKRETYERENDRLCRKPLAIKSRVGSGFDIDNIEDFNNLKNEKFFR